MSHKKIAVKDLEAWIESFTNYYYAFHWERKKKVESMKNQVTLAFELKLWEA